MSEHEKTDGADERFASRAKMLFDESVRDLDGATQSRLNRGRQEALARATTGAQTARWNQWLPAAGVAATAAFVVMIWPSGQQTDVLTPPTSAADFELLLERDEFEMLQELEFYSWIDVDDVSGFNVSPNVS